MNKENINNLNYILEGEYMAINNFDDLIGHATDANNNELRKIQQTHRELASRISTKIQKLGGNPSGSIGIQGIVSATISNIKHISATDNTSYLKEALLSEHQGIKNVNEFFSDTDDPVTSEILNTIITEYQNNINSLNTLIITSSNIQ
ncbi:MAG TPA: ferritin-like domain-containing protein [Clostridium sp.]|uniref:ferritin-like domain-containing protein n=1 Tax=Clostridium sp. TaxID=1506 RepID=UPI002F95AFA7